MSRPAPLYGLLLVGGKSTRMGTDKAQLIYQSNTPEWQRLHRLLEQTCEQVYLCHRQEQDFGKPAIIDPGNGPLYAIHSAQEAQPDAAWLVLACDLPLLTATTLNHLIQHRQPHNIATSFLSAIDKLPEPLCTIYEPAISSIIKQSLTNQERNLRNLLKKAHTIPLPDKNSLFNANTKADTLEIQTILNDTQMHKTLTLQYFAQLKDITQKESETIQTTATTASGLYEQLRKSYAFPYKQKQLMLAINDEFANWEHPLTDKDNVVFIPPVAGG